MRPTLAAGRPAASVLALRSLAACSNAFRRLRPTDLGWSRMRFGMFVPQGWRHDLVGIDPAEHWAAMRALAAARRCRTPGSRSGSTTTSTPCRCRPDRGDARGVDADGGVRRVDVARAPRPDVHLHELPQPGLPRQGRRDRRPRSRADASRWASAAAGTSTSGAPTATASRAIGERLGRLREGVEIMHQAWTTGAATLDGSYYQVDGAIVRPLPLQEGGIPLWIAGGGEKVTLRIAAKYASVHELHGHARGVRAQERGAARALRGARHATSTRSRARRTSTPSSATTEAEVARPARRDRGARRPVPRAREDRATFMAELRTRRTPPSARRRRWSSARRAARARPRLRHPLLPRGGVRPVGARALRAEVVPALQ